jgi:hypothetical protein
MSGERKILARIQLSLVMIFAGAFMLLSPDQISCHAAQPFPQFRTAVFEMPGTVLDVFAADMNHDGCCDFIVAHRTEIEPTIRCLSVFLQNAGGFRGKPDQTLPMNHGEILFQCTDTDGDSLQELVFLTEEGVFQKTWSRDSGFVGWVPLVRCQSVFPHADQAKIAFWRIIQDLNGDGIPDMLIPRSEWVDVYSRDEAGKFGLGRRLRVVPEYVLSEGKELSCSIRMPKLVIRDVNGDGNQDLFFVYRNFLDVFIQNPADRPDVPSALIPADLRFRFGSRDTAGNTDNPTPSALEVEDVNGDGRADVIEVRGSRDLLIHFNRWGRFDPVPDCVLSAGGISFGYTIRDFNHDGISDLAFVELSTGIKSLTQFLFSQKYRRILKCYFSRPDSVFAKKPDFQLSFKHKFQLNDPLGKKAFLSFEGDFNGDGLNDMVAGTVLDALQVYPALPGGVFAKKPAATIPVSASDSYRIVDVNGDGVSDVFFWYPDRADLHSRLVLVQSQKQDDALVVP